MFINKKFKSANKFKAVLTATLLLCTISVGFSQNKSRTITPKRTVVDTVLKVNQAQDYNSSRSNKPRPVAVKDDKLKNDTVRKLLQAEDDNSSRSNKPRPVVKDDKAGNDTVRKVKLMKGSKLK